MSSFLWNFDREKKEKKVYYLPLYQLVDSTSCRNMVKEHVSILQNNLLSTRQMNVRKISTQALKVSRTREAMAKSTILD